MNTLIKTLALLPLCALCAALLANGRVAAEDELPPPDPEHVVSCYGKWAPRDNGRKGFICRKDDIEPLLPKRCGQYSKAKALTFAGALAARLEPTMIAATNGLPSRDLAEMGLTNIKHFFEVDVNADQYSYGVILEDGQSGALVLDATRNEIFGSSLAPVVGGDPPTCNDRLNGVGMLMVILMIEHSAKIPCPK